MQTAVETKTEKAIVQWKGEAIAITFQDVKSLVCPLATDQETIIFLKTCQSLQLNPFANEIYLIKYARDGKAATVIAIESYLKAAEANSEYNGHEAGIILKDTSGQLDYRNGAFLLNEERSKLVGGWAKVYRKDRERPIYVAVSKAEAVKLTRGGVPTEFWAEEKQPWMLRKTALKRALVEAFPSLYEGILSTAEMEPDIEGELPRAFENNGKPNWRKFWVRAQDELGLSEERVHEILGVESVKEIVAKSSLEEAWNLLIERIREKNDAPSDDGETVIEEPVILFDDPEVPPLSQGFGAGVPIDMSWLNESLKALKDWNVADYIRNTFPGAKGKTLGEAVESLSYEQQEEFVKEVQRRLEAKTES